MHSALSCGFVIPSSASSPAPPCLFSFSLGRNLFLHFSCPVKRPPVLFGGENELSKSKSGPAGSSSAKTRTRSPGLSQLPSHALRSRGAVSLATCFCEGDESLGGGEETPELGHPQAAWVQAEAGRGRWRSHSDFSFFCGRAFLGKNSALRTGGPQSEDPRRSQRKAAPDSGWRQPPRGSGSYVRASR